MQYETLHNILMIILITFVFCISVIYLFYVSKINRYTVPQGLKELPLVKGFPLVGIVPQIKPPLMLYLKKLGLKHGPIFKVKIGMNDIVILNNFETIKSLVRDSGDAFSGRLQIQFISIITRDSGILFTEGEKWAKQRSFLLTVFRDFGLGKTKFVEIVQNECQILIDDLRQLGGKCTDFSHFIPSYTANIISKFIMNKRFSREDPQLIFIEKLLTDIAKRADYASWLYVMFPILNKYRFFTHLLYKITPQYKMFAKAHSFFQEEIENHKKTLDLDSEGEDLIDRFLIKQHEMKEKTGTIDSFTEWQLIRNSLELLMAGYETTSTTLGWSLLFMAKFPDIQEKVHLEIIDKIGNERMPSMNDKKNLNYSTAVMDEIMRLGTSVNLVIRKTFTDTTYKGYFIPKNSVVFPNLLSCHLDPNIWENPWEFRPERFLCVDSSGELKYNPREELIPFSLGKRQCIGESLARMEYFIFFIRILQNFKVSFLKKVTEKEYKEVLEGNDGIIRFSKIKDFIFSCRYQEK